MLNIFIIRNIYVQLNQMLDLEYSKTQPTPNNSAKSSYNTNKPSASSSEPVRP